MRNRVADDLGLAGFHLRLGLVHPTVCRCQIGAGTVIAQGTRIVNRSTPGNCRVFQGDSGGLVVKPPTRDVLGDLFR